MLTTTKPPMDAARWARLKDHVADLNELDPAGRGEAMAMLDLEATDQRWLAHLVSPVIADDPRLREPHPSARAAADGEQLRCKVGDVVGDYRVQGLLGRGGMGEVYEAVARNDGRLVALKVLRAGLAQTDYARFSANEQRALRRLDDPRIARFIEAFVEPQLGACLVLEFVDGDPLQTYCRSRRFSADARLRLFIEVCNAVASAHQQLVIHRDLKPGNVLVTPDGQVKLLDFGVAKLLDDGTGEPLAQTNTHGDLFTLDYAAPEQVLREPVSTVTDVYALGVLLFRLLTDSSPYARSDGRSLAAAVLNEPPQRLAAGLARAHVNGQPQPIPALDRDLDRVIARAMEKEPRNRYRSALELAADVQAVLDGRAIQGGGGAAYRLRKFVKRHRAAVAATMVAASALLAATGISVYAARNAERQAHRAQVANQFLLTTLDSTDRFSGSNRGELTLSDVLERAVANAHTELRDEPQVRADVLASLGMALLHRGKLDAAIGAARESHGIREANARIDAAEFAVSAQQLASMEIEAGQLLSASEHLDAALRRIEGDPAQQRVLISIYTSLGKLASIRGDAAASLALYEKILPLRESLPGDHAIDVAMDRNNLGTGLFNLSRFAESEQAYASGIAVLREHLGDSHPRLAFVQYGRIAALIQLGRFAEAAALLDTVEATLAAGEKSAAGAPGVINIDRTRAQLAYFASDYTGALHRLDAAIEQSRTASPAYVAATLVIRGRVELTSGDFPSAEKTFAEAIRLYVDNGRANHISRWYAQGLQGAAMAALGRDTAGEAQLDEALGNVIGDGRRPSAEQVDLLLYRGAMARQRGRTDDALVMHRRASAMRDDIGWLGELGSARVHAELAQDALIGKPSEADRASALSEIGEALARLRTVSPHDPLVARLTDVQRANGAP